MFNLLFILGSQQINISWIDLGISIIIMIITIIGTFYLMNRATEKRFEKKFTETSKIIHKKADKELTNTNINNIEKRIVEHKEYYKSQLGILQSLCEEQSQQMRAINSNIGKMSEDIAGINATVIELRDQMKELKPYVYK